MTFAAPGLARLVVLFCASGLAACSVMVYWQASHPQAVEGFARPWLYWTLPLTILAACVLLAKGHVKYLRLLLAASLLVGCLVPALCFAWMDNEMSRLQARAAGQIAGSRSSHGIPPEVLGLLLAYGVALLMVLLGFLNFALYRGEGEV